MVYRCAANGDGGGAAAAANNALVWTCSLLPSFLACLLLRRARSLVPRAEWFAPTLGSKHFREHFLKLHGKRGRVYPGLKCSSPSPSFNLDRRGQLVGPPFRVLLPDSKWTNKTRNRATSSFCRIPTARARLRAARVGRSVCRSLGESQEELDWRGKEESEDGEG